MPTVRRAKLQQALTLLAALLLFKVTADVVLGYQNYLPPNFGSDFLRGREDYFGGSYRWAFYTHIASGPMSLLVGTILISGSFRRRFPSWHRILGRLQVASILLLIVPSGLWMAYYAQAGTAAAVGFALLAVLTGTCAALGWRAAAQRRFATHQRWMGRCYTLLCSAIVIRILGGAATVSGVYVGWFDPLISWVSWIVPLAAFELSGLVSRTKGHLSLPAMVIKARRSEAGMSSERKLT